MRKSSLHLAAALLLANLTLLAGHRLAFSDWIIARGDTYSYHYPYWQARAEVIRAGALFSDAARWTDALFGGVPLLANPQFALYYPPNIALATLDAPEAVRLSALFHLFWSGLGAYALARGALRTGWLAGVVGGGAFLLGGHIGAHVEQINQLQGLAWMPWALWLLDRAIREDRQIGRAAFWTIGLALALGLQFLSGHTQTVFLTGAALGLYALCIRPIRGIVLLALAAGGAAVIALPQLLPTLELSRLGNRQDGFTLQQATAFSFSPFAIGRGLLPSFDRMIFSEYIAYPGIVVLALAVTGGVAALGRLPAPSPEREGARRARALVVIALVGLVLAFGIYNPIYALAYYLPGFGLFRVPARWLALLAIGAAGLAAFGVEGLRDRPARLPALIVTVMTVIGLMAAAPLITRTFDGTPAYPAESVTWVGWIVAAAIALIGLALTRSARARRFVVPLLATAAGVELLLASGALAYNAVIPPDAATAERFTISQMQAYIEADRADPNRSHRFLSMSDLLFDPGDRAALEARYDALGITGEARALAFDTVKLREVIGGNLPLLWGIPSFDGFDGGLLPTRAFSAYTSLMLPEGELRTLDGRLRESLYADSCGGPCIPDRRWLDLAGVRYLLTDKVYDLVRDGIFFDTTFPVTGEAVYANPTGFSARAIDVLYACAAQPCDPPTIDADAQSGSPSPLDRYQHLRFTFPTAVTPDALTVSAPPGVTVRAVTLVAVPAADSPLFAQLTPAPYRRLLSSDIRLYENTAVLPRAFPVGRARCVGDDAFGDEFALAVMDDPGFDPAREAVIAAPGAICAAYNADFDPAPSVTVTGAAAGSLTLQVSATAPALIVISTAHHPGWTARDASGAPLTVYRADVMFQAILIGAGENQAIFADFR